MTLRRALTAFWLLLARPLAAAPEAGAIVTNYPRPGGTQAAPQTLREAGFGRYNNREDDPVAVSAGEAESVRRALEAAARAPVLLLNDWRQARPGVAALQIVCNLPVQGALYTVMLPPGWGRDQKRAILLSANGSGCSNNCRLFQRRDTFLAELAAGGGLIAASSNAGGQESQGLDPQTLGSVGKFLEFLGHEGGDPRHVITYGVSRGGSDAVVWAANPLGLAYHADLAVAESLVWEYGSMLAEDPLLNPVHHAIQYPGQPWSAQARLRMWTGTPDVKAADAASPGGYLGRLRRTHLVFDLGSHDGSYSAPWFFKYEARLKRAGIPYTAVLALGAGHDSFAWTRDLLRRAAGELASGRSPRLPSGRVLLADGLPAGGTIPAFAVLPRAVVVGQELRVLVCARSGSRVELDAGRADAGTLTSVQAAFAEEGCRLERAPEVHSPGPVVWRMAVNGRQVPPYNVPGAHRSCSARATTLVGTVLPMYSTEDYRDLLRSPGLLEYGGPPADCPGDRGS